MLTWIQTHPAAAGAVAILTAFAIVCAFLAMDRLRNHLDARKAAPSELAGAPEGGNPTVRMPRFR
jgi:HAMP domain-containing protein